jgi:hypothetical protein
MGKKPIRFKLIERIQSKTLETDIIGSIIEKINDRKNFLTLSHHIYLGEP